jgi:lactate dehydrogenase-like 2-hydroxyacid dehydrogenase
MDPGGVCARETLIDESALLAALAAGHVAVSAHHAMTWRDG